VNTGALRSRVAIRVDASVRTGSGHVMRCLTLADELRTQGADVRFITRAHTGHLDALIQTRGFVVHSLAMREQPADATSEDPPAKHEPAHAAWLGCRWQDDRDDTARMLHVIGHVDWLVIDHYALDSRWESGLREHATHLFVIDDLADREHDADLLLDQNLVANAAQRYRAHTATSCRLLSGPGYALLRPEFAAARERAARHSVAVPASVLVFFGGVDATDETGKFLAAWSAHDAQRFVAQIVVGAHHPKRAAHARCALPGIRMLGYVDTMATLMAEADHAFGASGTSNWERFCVGLDASLVAVADNQTAIARYLGQHDWANDLGDAHETSPGTYRAALDALDPASPGARMRRARLMNQVDGRGTSKVVAHMLAMQEAR
jgi:UDP-2,4-diacetamido-2,4,6-trideoxy-beta-L-altropyranose hydrolase